MNIESTLSAMTTEDKVRFLAGKGMWTTWDLPAVGVLSVIMTDGPHGLRLNPELETYGRSLQEGRSSDELLTALPSTAFPVEAAMASTWNEDLIHEMAHALAEECLWRGVSLLLGPGLNGKRSPLGGRNFEYFSEDPYLSGRMGIAFVRGLQGAGVGACAKHFVANDQETNRTVVDAVVDERTLREIYLLPFEMVVREAAPWAIMAALNKVNGTFMWKNRDYLTDVLKGEWGFQGAVISDWSAVTDKVGALQAGLDLEMPGPGGEDHHVMEAFRSGVLTGEALDEHARRVLALVRKAAERARSGQECDVDAHHDVAVRVAEEAVVLLKNDGRVLPLVLGCRLAVIGRMAREPRFQGAGSSLLNPSRLSIPLDEMRRRADVAYAEGYGPGDPTVLIREACAAARGRDAVVLFVGTTEETESEGFDRSSISLPAAQLELIRAVSSVNPRVAVVTHCGSALDIGALASHAPAILHAWLPGQGGGAALARVLFGDVNPSGKLSESFPVRLEHAPSYLSFPGTMDRVFYDERIFTGYRYYETKEIDVLFPFGHGISYTRFEYSDLRFSAERLRAGESLTVSVDVTNAGGRAGKEAVQVYVRDCECSVLKPQKELKGFRKMSLEAGESKTATVVLNERAFSHYVPHLGRFAVEAGEFEILVGASSGDIRLSGRVHRDSDDDTLIPLGAHHPIALWLEDPRTARVMREILAVLSMDEGSSWYRLIATVPVGRLPALVERIGLPGETVKRQIVEGLGIDIEKHPRSRGQEEP